MGQEKVNARSLLDRGSALSFTVLALQRSPMPNTYLGERRITPQTIRVTYALQVCLLMVKMEALTPMRFPPDIRLVEKRLHLVQQGAKGCLGIREVVEHIDCPEDINTGDGCDSCGCTHIASWFLC